jgi:hypothetical protein
MLGDCSNTSRSNLLERLRKCAKTKKIQANACAKSITASGGALISIGVLKKIKGLIILNRISATGNEV